MKNIIVQLTISLSKASILLLNVEKPPVAIVVIEWHRALKRVSLSILKIIPSR
jgi:hypothetical protein